MKNSYTRLLFSFLVFVVAGLLVALLPLGLIPFITDLEEVYFRTETGDVYSNAGEYLNFLIGIPAAIFIAIVTAFLAFGTWRVARSQENLDRAQYITDRFNSASRQFAELAGALENIRTAGRKIYESVGILSEEYYEWLQEGHENSDHGMLEADEKSLIEDEQRALMLKDIRSQNPDKISRAIDFLFVKSRQKDTPLSDVDMPMQSWREPHQLAEAIEHFDGCMASVSDMTSRIARDPVARTIAQAAMELNWDLFIEQKKLDQGKPLFQAGVSAFDRMKSAEEKSDNQVSYEFVINPERMLLVSTLIDYYRDTTNVLDIVIAKRFEHSENNNSSYFLFAGLLLNAVFAVVTKNQQGESKTEKAQTCLNFGAMLLSTLLLYFGPGDAKTSKKIIRKVLVDLFPGDAANFEDEDLLKLTNFLPNRRQDLTQSLSQELESILTNSDTKLVTLLCDGKCEPFELKKHGKFFMQNGAEKQGSLRRLFKQSETSNPGLEKMPVKTTEADPARVLFAHKVDRFSGGSATAEKDAFFSLSKKERLSFLQKISQ